MTGFTTLTSRLSRAPAIKSTGLIVGTSLTAIVALMPINEARAEVRWIKPGANPPTGMAFIQAGTEANNVNADKPIYVCRATYENGLHPGKTVGESCAISYGGREINRPQFEVAVARPGSYVWGPPGQPVAVIVGGQEPGRSLTICRSEFHSSADNRNVISHGQHAGKVVDGSCAFGYGGNEIMSTIYEVLYDADRLPENGAISPAKQPATSPTNSQQDNRLSGPGQ